MSWDKNTIITSDIDFIIRLLDRFKVRYKIKIIGEVAGLGLNDYFAGRDVYQIRKLTYCDIVVLEQMHRTHDCDSDDVLTSKEFKKKDVPKKWPLETYIEGFDNKSILIQNKEE